MSTNIIENPVFHRFFDREHKRLIYLGKNATSELWDSLWSLDKETVHKWLKANREGAQLVTLTNHYLKPTEGIILEGGCGRGQFVAALKCAGFQVIGVDFAQATVDVLNRHAPELDIRVGDLRSLPLSDASVAGYWSIGVIEHFWNGYAPIASEMSRVIKDGGYLFCSFPYMNPLRRLKAHLNLYQDSNFESEPAGFYQFALSKTEVIKTMSEFGFTLLAARPSNGFKGILGECAMISMVLEKIYSYNGSSLIIRGLRRFFDFGFTIMGCPHSILLIFQRKSRSYGNGSTNCTVQKL